MDTQSIAVKAAVTAGTLLVGYLGYIYLSSPLTAFPGPFWPQFTDLWRLWDYWSSTQIDTHRKLHEKHGPAVRIGPNLISLSDPSLIKTVYSTRGDYVKSDFYEVADAVAGGHRIENVFSTRSNTFHGKYMKPYSKLFTMNKILEKERLADRMITLLCEQLEERFVVGMNAGTTVDIANWIEYGAWDFVWNNTFSQDMGFLKSGEDINGLIHTGEMTMRYLGCIGQMPWLDRWLGKNPWCPIKFATFNNVAMYCGERIMERVQSSGSRATPDFLDDFIACKEQYPGVVGDNEVVSYLMMNVLAGADTTSLVQKAIVYHILCNEPVYKRLQKELRTANLSFPPQYNETKDLPYLHACIREGGRMHPVLGGIAERVVPERGLSLPDGRFIAPGTKVGFNPWVSSRNKEVYGEDVDLYRPERWLRGGKETEEDFSRRLSLMNQSDLCFGAGNRTCAGKNLATMELHKMTSSLLSRYNIRLVQNGWSPRWWWFCFIDNIKVELELCQDSLR